MKFEITFLIREFKDFEDKDICSDKRCIIIDFDQSLSMTKAKDLIENNFDIQNILNSFPQGGRIEVLEIGRA